MKISKITSLMFLLVSVTFSHIANAQKIFSVKYKSDADVKVYVCDYKSDADLIVYKCSYKSNASKNLLRIIFYFLQILII